MNARQFQHKQRLGWLAVFAVIGTVCAVGLSFLTHYLLFFGDDINPYQRSLTAALILPVMIAFPLFAYIGYIRQLLQISQRERNFAAAHDLSTEVLTSSSFATLLERRNSVSISESGRTFGALLVIEAQNTSKINRDYGYQWGEESMRKIASVIRSNVRRSDVVGRLNSSEFGVFLPGASVEAAHRVGERIRSAAEKIPFLVEGDQVELALDIGGVIFEDQIEIQSMMKFASEELDAARANGREGLSIRSNELPEEQQRKVN